MSIENEIRDQIENIKKLKQEVGYINNHLSILEGFCREDKQNQVDDAYKRGLEDAWEAAKKLGLSSEHGGMTVSTVREIFDGEYPLEVFKNYTAKEAVDKIKAYEERKDDSIKVGDEVRHKSHNTSWTAVVIKREEDVIYLMGHSGAVADYQLSGFEKTGRHFDIQSILEAMRT